MGEVPQKKYPTVYLYFKGIYIWQDKRINVLLFIFLPPSDTPPSHCSVTVLMTYSFNIIRGKMDLFSICNLTIETSYKKVQFIIQNVNPLQKLVSSSIHMSNIYLTIFDFEKVKVFNYNFKCEANTITNCLWYVFFYTILDFKLLTKSNTNNNAFSGRFNDTPH